MKKSLKYIFIFVLLSLVGHSYVIYKFYHDGILFTGPNDGMEQMVPIQMFLFNQWSHGNWFYSSDFGLGGDFFTDLSYYFSTNILFIINALIIMLLKLVIHLDTSQLLFWMNNALIVSIIKASIALYCTYLFETGQCTGWRKSPVIPCLKNRKGPLCGFSKNVRGDQALFAREGVTGLLAHPVSA